MLASGALSLASHTLLGILQLVACVLAVLNTLILYEKRRREAMISSAKKD